MVTYKLGSGGAREYTTRGIPVKGGLFGNVKISYVCILGDAIHEYVPGSDHVNIYTTAEMLGNAVLKQIIKRG